MSNIYQDNGHESRKAYLQHLADENEVDVDVVHAIAGVLGPSEDFDGLVTAVEDAALDIARRAG